MKYFRLYKRLFVMHFMKDLAYRGNFLLSSFLVMVESVAVFIGLKVIFLHVDAIAGWSYDELLVLLGTYMITHSLAWVWYKAGINRLDILITNGDFDWFLVRPIDPQYMAGIYSIDIEDAARSIVGIALLVLGLQDTSWIFILAALPTYFFLLLLGQIVLYSIYLSLKTISFKSIQGWAGNSISFRLHELTQYPTDIYTGVLQRIYTSIIPLIFVATVPAKALTGKITPGLVVGAILAAILSFCAARGIWSFMLKRYSSASS